MRADLLAVAIVAAGALAFEVLLARLLSIVHWHHFVGMVISLALLGYGASGSVLTALLDRLRPFAALAFAVSATMFGAAALAAVAIAEALPFNALEIIWSPWQWLWLGLLYLLFATPFAFAAGCTGIALACVDAPVGRVYRADLLGAGAGSLAAVGLLDVLRPDQALWIAAAAGPVAATIMLAGAGRFRAAAGALAAVGMIGIAAVAGWPGLAMSPFKPLPQTLLVDGTAVIAERTSPIGLVQVVRSETIPFRSVTGLSLANRQEPAAQLGLFIDGEGPAPVTRFAGDFAPLAYLDATLAAFPYRLIRDRPRVLLLGLGGGSDLLLALRHEARAIDVVEPDGSVASLLRGELADFSGGILNRPEVHLHIESARRFAERDGPDYDLIVLDASPGRGGALAETFPLTVEAFAAYLRRLAPDGVLALPHPLRLPPRDSLKLALTAIAALDRLSEPEPARHLAFVRSWDHVAMVVRRQPFDAEQLAAIEAFAGRLNFDLGWHPDMPRDAANSFNILAEPELFDGVAAIAGPARDRFVEDYAFDIRPATDDRPYFGDMFRWRALPVLWAAARAGNAGLLDWGWPVQVATLGIAVVAALVLILLPARLLAGRVAGREGLATAAYFLMIGTGFIFVEIAVMQHLVLFLGDPVHAFAITLAAFLVFAGLGSGVAAAAETGPTGRSAQWVPTVGLAVAAIAVFALLHAFAWLALPMPEGLGTLARAAAAIAGIAPLAFAMGFPFPVVLARIRTTAPATVPWAWGVNGCASVIAAALAVLVGASLGAQALMLIGVLAYLLAALARRWLP